MGQVAGPAISLSLSSNRQYTLPSANAPAVGCALLDFGVHGSLANTRLLDWSARPVLISPAVAGSASTDYLAHDGTWKTIPPVISPSGSGTELQFRNGSSFGAVANSSVSGSSVTLGSKLTVYATPSLTRSVALELINASETAVGSDPSDYNDEVHLVLQAGTSNNHRRYIDWKNYDGSDAYLMGVNAGGNFILYDSLLGHRQYGSSLGFTQVNSFGTEAVEINNYPGPDELGTGGLKVYSGGPSTGRIVWSHIGQDIWANRRIYWGGTDSGTATGRLNTSGIDAYIDAFQDGGAMYFRNNVGGSMQNALSLSSSSAAFSNSVTINATPNLTRTVALELVNTAETAIGSDPNDYRDEVHLVLKAGTSNNHRRYIDWKNYDGSDAYLMGVNAGGSFILYDSLLGHRMYGASNLTQVNSFGSEAVEINNYPGPDELGTGGLKVYSGGPSTGRSLWAKLSQDIWSSRRVFWGGIDDSTATGRLNTSGIDAYIDAYQDGGSLHFRNNVGGSMQNALTIASAGAVFGVHVTSVFQTLSADPTTTDITTSNSRLVKNSTSGTLKLWANDGGLMKSVALA